MHAIDLANPVVLVCSGGGVGALGARSTTELQPGAYQVHTTDEVRLRQGSQVPSLQDLPVLPGSPVTVLVTASHVAASSVGGTAVVSLYRLADLALRGCE